MIDPAFQLKEALEFGSFQFVSIEYSFENPRLVSMDLIESGLKLPSFGRTDTVVATALRVHLMTNILVVPHIMEPATVIVINQEVLHPWVILDPVDIATNAAEAGQIIFVVVGHVWRKEKSRLV